MRILDTVVLIAYLDEKDPRSQKATEYVLDIELKPDIFVPSATLLEFDLELKTHGVPVDAREALHFKLARAIPRARILPLTPAVLARATALSRDAAWRDSYFDTMIAATALEFGANSAITTDRRFSKLGIEPVF
jgi:predicted nucleic acid-binding protein